MRFGGIELKRPSNHGSRKRSRRSFNSVNPTTSLRFEASGEKSGVARVFISALFVYSYSYASDKGTSKATEGLPLVPSNIH